MGSILTMEQGELIHLIPALAYHAFHTFQSGRSISTEHKTLLISRSCLYHQRLLYTSVQCDCYLPTLCTVSWAPNYDHQTANRVLRLMLCNIGHRALAHMKEIYFLFARRQFCTCISIFVLHCIPATRLHELASLLTCQSRSHSSSTTPPGFRLLNN